MPNIKRKGCILKIPKKAQGLPSNFDDSTQLTADHVF